MRSITSPGLVDLHFHGAYGIDLMRADTPALDELARRLFEQGIGAFCPTTLSAPEADLHPAVERLGHWTRQRQSSRAPKQSIPLGLHLEGPFLSPKACGAHPPGSLRAATLAELERLWKISEGTIRILTLAPEEIPDGERKAILRWARKKQIRLSAGHSRATLPQARAAFAEGFTGVTHAWNALAFHHRDPGVLGAAIGHPDVFIELIADGHHVAPELLRWTLKCHNQCCLVSDAVPAAGLPAGKSCSFGPLEISCVDGACRLPSGALAGGGQLLSTTVARWTEKEAKHSGQSIQTTFAKTIPYATQNPLVYLFGKATGMKELRRLKKHCPVQWKTSAKGRLTWRSP